MYIKTNIFSSNKYNIICGACITYLVYFHQNPFQATHLIKESYTKSNVCWKSVHIRVGKVHTLKIASRGHFLEMLCSIIGYIEYS